MKQKTRYWEGARSTPSAVPGSVCETVENCGGGSQKTGCWADPNGLGKQGKTTDRAVRATRGLAGSRPAGWRGLIEGGGDRGVVGLTREGGELVEPGFAGGPAGGYTWELGGVTAGTNRSILDEKEKRRRFRRREWGSPGPADRCAAAELGSV